MRALTSRHGPDGSPDVSRDGKRVAWTGFDDKYQGYQVARLSVMDVSGGAPAQSSLFNRPFRRSHR